MANQNPTSGSKVGDALRDASHKLGEKVGDLGDRAADKSDELANKVSDVGTNVTDYVKKHPTQSLLIAGVAGWLLGKILRI